MLEPSGEFHSVVLFLRSLGPGGPATSEMAHWLYGWLSHRLQPAEMESGLRLHGSRALTLSPLLEESRAAPAIAVETGRRYAFRLGFLEGFGYANWRGRLWPSLRDDLRLGPHVFSPLDWTEDPAEHPLAGRATVGELVRWGELHAGDSLTMLFLTPTVFKSTFRPADGAISARAKPIDVEVPLPDPARIISSLAGRWQRFAPPGATIPEDLVEMAKQTTGISCLEVRTEGGRGERKTRGFLGWAELRCLAPRPEARAVFATLCALGNFAGVGAKTALGMGMIQVLSNRARMEPSP